MNVRSEQLADVMASSFETYVPALRRYFSKRVAPSEIDDLIQEVLVRMHALTASMSQSGSGTSTASSIH